MVTALFALAGIAGAVRLSAVHHLPADELTASVLTLLAGPLVAVLGVLIARQNAVTGILALVAGSIALMAAAGTIVALVAAAFGMVTGLFAVFETRRANRGPHQPGGERAPGSSSSGISPLHRAPEGRLLSPQRLERWMLLGVLGVVIGLVTAGLYAFSFPHGGTDDEILGWYSEDRNGLIYSAFLGGIASGVGLLLVFGGIYGPMRSAEGGAGILSVVMLAAATTATSLHMVASTLRVSMGMVYQYDPHFGVAGVDPQLVRYIEALAFGIQSMSSAILAIAVGALATVSLRTRQVCPAWLGWLTAAVAVLLFLDFPLFGIPFTVFVGWAVLFATTRLLLVRPDRQPGPGVSQGSERPEVNLQASTGSAE